MAAKEIVFAITGATGTLGGIAAANLNALYAIMKLVERTGHRLRVLSLGEKDADRPSFLPGDAHFSGFDGSKSRFSLALLHSFGLDTLFIFDHVRLAMPLSPFLALGRGKCVIFAHGSEAWRRVRPSSRWLFRRAAVCLTNSSFTLKRMHEKFAGFDAAACLLGLSPEYALNDRVPRAADEEMTLTSVDGVERRIGERMLLLVGRMDPGEREKGHLQLMNVWPGVLDKHPQAQLVFAGPGEDRALYCEHAEKRRIASSVFIPGAQTIGIMQRLYGKCYGFVMPSKQEGFGLVYLEAMNYAKPCIGCYDSGGEDVILDGETGLLIRDPNDQSELEGAVERLFESEAAARTMGIRGWERLHENFTSDHAQRRLIENLSHLI